MNRRITWAVALLMLGLPAAAPAGDLPESFTLGRYVPDSCAIYIHGVQNPKRSLIDEQWARVFAALKKCGALDEVRAVVAEHLDADDRIEFEAHWAKAIELGSAVSWGDLVEREFVWAVRVSPLPSYLVLCRGKPGSGPANLTALTRLLEYLASLDEDLYLSKGCCSGGEFWSLTFPRVPISLELFGRGDVVGMSTSSLLAGEVASLLAGQKRSGAIVDSPRFRKGLASLPNPEDQLVFVDWRAVLNGVRSILQHARAGTAENKKTGEALIIVDRLVSRLDILDYTLTVQRTEGWHQHWQMVTTLQPEAKDKRLARIKTGRPPLHNPLAVVPAEATSCSASCGIDVKELYALFMDILVHDLPNSGWVLDRWLAVQEELGLDVQEDVLSWISGEVICFSMPRKVVTNIFHPVDGVMLLGISDAELADRKITAALEWLRGAILTHLHQPLVILPVPGIRAKGFRSVSVPILAMFPRPIVGVHGDWLVVGTSAEAINKYLDTAAGKAPSVTETKRFRAEGIQPSGPVHAITFSDERSSGKAAAGGFAVAGALMRTMPKEPEMIPVMAMFRVLARLQPVFEEINFMSSRASATTFDGSSWTTKGVLTCRPPPDHH